jgi:predicted permease
MTTLWPDLRYAIRMLRKSPGFTAIALVTLAIGIGANTIMFSMVNVLLLRPTQVRGLDELALCRMGDLSRGAFPYSAYTDLRNDNPAFRDLMAHDSGLTFVTLAREDVARRALAMFVSANYFSFLGVTPAYGRAFLPQEERSGAEPVVVLSYRAWQRQGGDLGLVGTHLSINGTLFRVVGIAPERFTGTAVLGPDLWLPLGSFGLVGHLGQRKPSDRPSDLWDYPTVAPVGRLKPGLTMAAAQVRLQSLAPRLKENLPRWWKDSDTLRLSRPPRLTPFSDGDDRKPAVGISLFLMSVSGVVLLIACLNLANMVVIHGTARHREMAIRRAIGGGRLRIVRQLLIESLLLAIFGGALGLVLAFWGTRILNTWVAAARFPIDPAGSLRTSLDVRVLMATLGFCLMATVLSGLRPALGLSRRDVVNDLKESGGGMLRSTRGARRPHGWSVVCQIALSVVLVMAATMFTRSSVNALRPNPDFDLDGKLLIEVDPLAGGYSRAGGAQLCEALAEHLRTLPGILAVALSDGFPLGERCERGSQLAECAPGVTNETEVSLRPSKSVYTLYAVGADFFESMGMPLLQGRAFERLDCSPDAEKVVIIDELLARRLRPAGSALGCLIQYGRLSWSAPCRVVGIAPHLRTVSDSQEDCPQIYAPMTTGRLPTYIHLRVAQVSRRVEAGLLARIPGEIRQVEPRLPILSATSLADSHRNNPFVWLAATGARMAIGFGAMALFLAALGIYAVKGFMVASRTSEIGIRKALGATHGNIIGMVLREGMMLTLVGLIVGLLLGLAAARLIGSLLYGVRPVDPISMAMTVVLLSVAALLAGYLPARRAARVDPMVALRCE